MSETAIVKDFTECFEKKVDWNGTTYNMIFVPKYDEPTKFVSPGYWKPSRAVTHAEHPACNTHTNLYSREELIASGAKQRTEYLWARKKESK